MYIKKFKLFTENKDELNHCECDSVCKCSGDNSDDSDSQEYEYQFRDIDDGVYYKRKKGDKLWEFTTKEDYENNSITYKGGKI